MKIVIEGNIGCGKSTLLSRLASETRIPVFLEPVDNEWKEGLTHFYEDPLRWGFSFNLKVLQTYYKWKNINFLSIYERSPLSCRNIFFAQQVKEGAMTNFEIELFDEFFKQMSWKPDVLIYVKTPPQVCFDRMFSRARECEGGVPITYLESIHNQYEEMLHTFKNDKDIKIYEVDGCQDRDEVYMQVLKIVNELK
jgi:deoxyadenosine/deoxycytidine kinase